MNWSQYLTQFTILDKMNTNRALNRPTAVIWVSLNYKQHSSLSAIYCHSPIQPYLSSWLDQPTTNHRHRNSSSMQYPSISFTSQGVLSLLGCALSVTWQNIKAQLTQLEATTNWLICLKTEWYYFHPLRSMINLIS